MRKVLIFLAIIIISIQVESFAKYAFEFKENAMKIDIDNTPPNIEIIDIKNTNKEYPLYANKNHEIVIKLKIQDKNELINQLTEFVIMVGDNESKCSKELCIKEKNTNYIIYEIKLTNLSENGELKIKVPKQSFKDIYENISDETVIKTDVQIDNIAPVVEYKQQILKDGKILAQIFSNEKIRDIPGWEIDNSKQICSKQFISDINYYKTITDYAGNISEKLEIKVEKSSYLDLNIKAHISMLGWIDIKNNLAGIQQQNNKYKVESLMFTINDRLGKNFLKVAGYAHTYWSKGSTAKSDFSDTLYNCGYNPINGYYTIENADLVAEGNKEYIKIAGEGINRAHNTDINGNNPIPEDIAKKYNYGISSIKLDLNDKKEYSIIYQIFFNSTGWSQTYKNGEEAIKDYSKPFEGIKVAIVPNSELNEIVKEWNSKEGSTNLE